MSAEATSVLRQHLSVKQLPFSSWTCDSLTQTATFPSINTPYLYVATAGSPEWSPAPFAFHVEDSALYTLNYLHASVRKYWVVVDLRDAKRLEWRICGSCGLPPPSQQCCQFVRHQSLWVPVEVLDLWDIRYTTLQHNAGKLVVTVPSAYHQGWNGGWNVAEAINYGDGKSAARVRGYRYCTMKCVPKGEKPLLVKRPEVPALPVAPSLWTWGAPKTYVPVGARNEPLSLNGLLLSGKKPLGDDHVSWHPSDFSFLFQTSRLPALCLQWRFTDIDVYDPIDLICD